MALHLVLGELEIDEARFELRRSGRALSVQPKVLELILHLARHRERVVTKDELFDTVWRGVNVSEASLSQALSLARRVLGDTASDQRIIRTVRGKGLQFVAGAATTLSPAVAPHLASSTLATQEQLERSTATDEVHLVAALHCEALSLGSTCWSLAEIDEVEIGRGSQLRAERRGDITRVCRIVVPGRLMSRKHARLSRTPQGWLLIDADSRNGTRIDGARIDRRVLKAGDVFACGLTLFQLVVAPPARPAERSVIPSALPSLQAIDADLCRLVAAPEVPVVVVGESGVGKTHLAEALHARSGRDELIRIPAGASKLPEAIAPRSTVLIEDLERLPAQWATRLSDALEQATEPWLLATSTAAPSDLDLPPHLATRLGGYVCRLPPLRERRGDLGLLVQRMGADAILEIDIDVGWAWMRHAWPGNLRELRHQLTRATALSARGVVALEHLPAMASEAPS